MNVILSMSIAFAIVCALLFAKMLSLSRQIRTLRHRLEELVQTLALKEIDDDL